jgi:hypothetical protein
MEFLEPFPNCGESPVVPESLENLGIGEVLGFEIFPSKSDIQPEASSGERLRGE